MAKDIHVQNLLRERLKYQSNAPIREFVQNTEPKDADFDAYASAIDTVIDQAIGEVIEFKGLDKKFDDSEFAKP